MRDSTKKAIADLNKKLSEQRRKDLALSKKQSDQLIELTKKMRERASDQLEQLRKKPGK